MEQNVPFVDDPTNTDERYTRNRIRARLLPALAESFPQFRETFARSAQHATRIRRCWMKWKMRATLWRSFLWRDELLASVLKYSC